MSDGAFPDRLTQLRNRWEADPSSRIFLQLAEEYRHQGRVKEALDVLDRGLREHPGYLSALVAKGRCHLELGEPEPARAVLERVVKQDATQMVANKLLVRAYLDTGEADRARERLDLYTLLNDSDPEIEDLRRRLRTMEQPPQAQAPDPFQAPDSPFSYTAQAASSPPADDVFDLGLPAPRRASADVFELDVPAATAPPPPSVIEPAAIPVAPRAMEPAEEPEPEDVVFPGLATRDSRRRYLQSLTTGGIFLVDLGLVPEPETIPEPEIAPEPEPEPVQEEPAPVFAFEPEPIVAEAEPVYDFEPAPIPEPVFASEPPLEPAPEPAASPAATATLGEIYLSQGHLGEAERIFREVLSREPDNAEALVGLERLAARRAERRPVSGRDLLAGYEPGEEGGETEASGRARPGCSPNI